MSNKLNAMFAVLQEQFDTKKMMLEITCLTHHIKRILEKLQMSKEGSENIDILFQAKIKAEIK